MRARSIVAVLTLVLAGACGDDASGGGPAADDAADGRVRPDATQQSDEDVAEAPPDLDEPDAVEDVAADPDPAEDATVDPDLPDEPDRVEADPDAPADSASEEIVPTDDCEPLGIPDRWVGTFDGDIVSDIPDIAGYTFQGPVTGAMRFQIWCINEKLVVLGELDGGATNCALATGCPFTAQLDGLYDPETQHMQGEILDAVIDYTFVQVYAEGQFEGDLSDGPVLSGVWSGEMTGNSLNLNRHASGEGTWEATPAGP